MKSAVAVLVLTAASLAGEMQIHRDLTYFEPAGDQGQLDLYAPVEGQNHPVVIWIHGGGWKRGDKASVQHKPQAFVDQGDLFVSINYRFVPNVTVEDMTGDVARAIRWVHDHARDYGGDPASIIVMGHSAGAHLAALVCTDERFLQSAGLELSSICGCVPVDVSVYDIPKRLKDGGSVPPATFLEIFGESAELQRDFSPALHVSADKGIPPFLILYVADRPETKVQSEWFAQKLRDAGVKATVVPGQGKTHGSIGSDLGLPEDLPTQAVFRFLKEVVHPAD